MSFRLGGFCPAPRYFSQSPSFTRDFSHQRACAERAVDFYRKGVARIEDRWVPGTGQIRPTDRIDTHSSLYATDLDLFGPGSLFELLSFARTRMGEDTLASWLLIPCPLADIKTPRRPLRTSHPP